MLSTGDQFPSFKEFKAAVADWSIKERFFYNVYKSDKVRTIIRCRAVACSFTVRAFWKMEEDIVEVGKVDPIHICYGSGEYSRSASSKHSWLVESLPKTLTIDNKTTPATIVQAVLHTHHEKITTAAASKAKRALLGNGLKAQAAQYALLPAYAEALEKLDAYVQIAINKDSDRFERIFICPPTSRESFSHCRPFLAIDGTAPGRN